MGRDPISHGQWAKLLGAREASHNWKTRVETKTHRPTLDRDRAILFTLLDTGARASKLCGIRFQDLNLANRTIKLRGKGPGREEPKERLVSVGKAIADAINKTLRPRLGQIQPTSPLFVIRHCELKARRRFKLQYGRNPDFYKDKAMTLIKLCWCIRGGETHCRIQLTDWHIAARWRNKGERH